MAENKVVQVLKLLSKKEIRLLDKYVRSPLFNQHADVICLFEYLRGVLHEGNGLLSNEAIFAHLFPGQVFEVQKLHHVNSYLLKLLQGFLAWLEWQEEEAEISLYLLRALRKRRLDEPFIRIFESHETSQNKQPLRDARYYNHQYRSHFEMVKYQSGRRSDDLHLQQLSDAQDIAYIIEKLYNACTMLSHQAVVRKEYDTGLLSRVLAYVEQSPLLEVPGVALYYHAYQALSNPGEDTHFYHLKKLLHQYRGQFAVGELRDLYILAVNFCIRKINQGDKRFLQEVFELYKSGLDAGVFLEEGQLSRWTYNNITVAGLKLKEFDWVENFIHDFAEKLPPNHREGSRNFNLAYYYFEKKDYQKAMPLLLQIDHDDVLHNLFAKSTLAKMYYELSEIKALESLLQSLKTYIRRKKVLGYHKTNYLNFIRYTGKLTSVNFFDKEALRHLRDMIVKERYVAEKEWLIQQVDNIS